MNFMKHMMQGHLRRPCTCRAHKTWHQFVERNAVVRTLNRSASGRHGCVLRATEYYLQEYSVYRCIHCGRQKNLPSGSKRISKEDAAASDLETVRNLAFWSAMDR